jgi:uncharacterized protein DUF2442
MVGGEQLKLLGRPAEALSMRRIESKHQITGIHVARGRMVVTIDGRRHDFDLAQLSPRLARATPHEQATVEVSPAGYGLH